MWVHARGPAGRDNSAAQGIGNIILSMAGSSRCAPLNEGPADLMGIQKYLESGMIKGIGPAYAERIVENFGLETLKVIDQDPRNSCWRSQGIGEKRVEQIMRCWQEQRRSRGDGLLEGPWISPAFAQKIFKPYGDQSIAKVKQNPYGSPGIFLGSALKRPTDRATNRGYPSSRYASDAGI